MLIVPEMSDGGQLMAVAATQTTSPAQVRKLVIAGQLGFVPTGIINTILGPMLPILSAHWALNDTQAGNLFVVQFLGSMTGVLLSGILLAKLGFRPAFLLGLVLMAIGISTVYAPTLWAGLIAVAILGLGQGFIIPTDNLLIAEISPDSRAAAVALLNFYWGIGAVFCSLAVAWAYVHHLLPLFLGSVAVLLILLALGVRRLPFPGKLHSQETPLIWKEVLRSPVFWLFSMVFFFYPGAETAVGGWINSYVTRMGYAHVGPVMPAFFWFALTLGRACAGPVLRRVSEHNVMRGGFAIATIGIALMLWTSTLIGVIASVVLVGLSYAILYPVNVARLSQHFGPSARAIGSIMFALAGLGPALVPKWVGMVSTSTGNLRVGLAVPLAATVLLLIIHLREW